MSRIKCIAFDCFGTLFDMSGISRDEINDYVGHVRNERFSPFPFPRSWWDLKCHPDVPKGMESLRLMGISCVALSNGSVDLIEHVSVSGGFCFDHIVDLVGHGVYKPNVNAYWLVKNDIGFETFETLMVTSNPTFGDIEGAAAVGMQSQVIRQPGKIQTIIELAELLK